MDAKKFHDVLYNLPIIPLLRKEIEWQQENWPKPSQSQSLDTWVRFIQKHLELAKDHVFNDRQEAALEELRILVGVGIGSLMAYETPER